MKKPNFKITAIFFSFLILAACASSKKLADSYAGKWGYEIETPQGNYNGNMEIIKDGKIFTGKLNSDMGSVDLNDLVIKDGKLTANFDMQGNSINISGDFQGEVFNGNVEAGGFQIPFKATKIKE
jgi:hypothetical protein